MFAKKLPDEICCVIHDFAKTKRKTRPRQGQQDKGGDYGLCIQT